MSVPAFHSIEPSPQAGSAGRREEQTAREARSVSGHPTVAKDSKEGKQKGEREGKSETQGRTEDRKPEAYQREAHQRLLRALGPNRAEQDLAYQGLRHRLTRLFEWRQVADPDTAADETLSRAARHLGEGIPLTTPDPLRCVLGVAHRVALEILWQERRNVRWVEPIGLGAAETQSNRLGDLQGVQEIDQVSRAYRPGASGYADWSCPRRCALDLALSELPGAERELLLDYHSQDASADPQLRFSQRRRCAAALGLAPAALHVRLHRLRKRLESAVRRHLERVERASTPLREPIRRFDDSA